MAVTGSLTSIDGLAEVPSGAPLPGPGLTQPWQVAQRGLTAHPADRAADGRPVALRVALSPAATERLNGPRVLRLLELELYDVAPTRPSLDGALEADVIRVWIDVPSPDRALIEVGRPERPVMRRALDIEGTPNDVSALVVMVAASELIRALAEPPPAPTPKPAAPAESPGEDDMLRGLPLAIDAAATGLFVHGTSTVALGGELGFTHRRHVTGQTLYARWLAAPEGGVPLRWFELGAGADFRVPLDGSRWRLRLAARAGGAAAQVLDATRVDGIRGQTSSWSARAGGLLGVERSLVDATWLSLVVEPGGTLRTIRGERHGGSVFALGGFAFSATLGITVDPSSRAPRPVVLALAPPGEANP